jgi:hypothetical protein
MCKADKRVKRRVFSSALSVTAALTVTIGYVKD